MKMVIDPWNFLRKMLIHHGFHWILDDSGYFQTNSHNALTSSKFSPHALSHVGRHGMSRSLLTDLFKVLTWKLIPNGSMVYFMVYFMEHPTEKWNKMDDLGYPMVTPIFTWCYMMLNKILWHCHTNLAGTLGASDLAIHWWEPWVWLLVVHFYQSSSRFSCSTFWKCKVRNPISSNPSHFEMKTHIYIYIYIHI